MESDVTEVRNCTSSSIVDPLNPTSRYEFVGVLRDKVVGSLLSMRHEFLPSSCFHVLAVPIIWK